MKFPALTAKGPVDSTVSAPWWFLVSSPIVPHVFQTPCKYWGLGSFGIYWLLCEERFGRGATVERLQELAVLEVQALQGELASSDQVRMHSVGVL